MNQFHDNQPIFVQITGRLVEMILSRAVGEGDPLPSVRQIAADLSVNPLTVTRAYQALVDLDVVESRRGMGMFVRDGARQRLLEHERTQFLEAEWPRIRARMAALEIDPATLFNQGSEDE